MDRRRAEPVGYRAPPVIASVRKGCRVKRVSREDGTSGNASRIPTAHLPIFGENRDDERGEERGERERERERKGEQREKKRGERVPFLTSLRTPQGL